MNHKVTTIYGQITVTQSDLVREFEESCLFLWHWTRHPQRAGCVALLERKVTELLTLISQTGAAIKPTTQAYWNMLCEVWSPGGAFVTNHPLLK